MKNKVITLSNLGHTWLFDIDGTICKHNGYKLDGCDTILPGIKELFEKIPQSDIVILLTSRKKKYRQITEDFLRENGLRFDYIIFDLPYGERILLNDKKPSGLKTGLAINFERDEPDIVDIFIDDKL